jgi:hypothetical protein
MATAPDKTAVPAYTSYRPLIQWINGFRETGHVPMRVDKSHLPKASGSVQAGHIYALRFLKLIDDSGKPLPLFEKFVLASDEQRPAMLSSMLTDSYRFLFADSEFDLARASSRMLEEKFRALDIKGSTLLRAIAFFLAAAKDAGLKLAPGLKPPAAPPRTNDKKPANAGKKEPDSSGDEDDTDDNDTDGADVPGTLRFEIPIPVNRKVKISIPADFDEADWTLLQTMFNAYVTRWKGISAPTTSSKQGG